MISPSSMGISQKTWSLIGILVLSAWLSFLFVDGSSQRIAEDSQRLQKIDEVSQNAASIREQTTGNLSLNSESEQTHGSAFPTVENKQQSLQDIRALELLYRKNKDPQILVTLIQQLARDYQFKDANTYLQLLMKQDGYERVLDVKVILYIMLHSDGISYDVPTSINALLPYIQYYRNEGLLSKDDELLYRGLIAIWGQQYAEASRLWAGLTTPDYLRVRESYQKALLAFSGTKYAPVYYQDGLVALSMLKNGYFSIAKKLALGVALQDTQYVLPYQVLAYANFLSNNWDVAAEYFLKLADFDTTNASMYTFLVGVSYYWLDDYEQSVLYLNQVTAPSLLSDVYRYKLLSYLAAQDMENAIRIRQKFLGQSDIRPSDFALFFKTFFYAPYSNGQPFLLATQNMPLVSMYLDACPRLFSGDQDVCRYGEVGQALSTSNWTGLAQQLLYLSSRYHQSYLFHVLGDYYFQYTAYDKAKDAYSQALSITTDSNEEIILKHQLEKVLEGSE